MSPWHAFVSISLTKVHCHQPAFWAYSQVSVFLGLSCPSEVSAGNMESSLDDKPSAWLQTHLLVDIFPDKSSPPSSEHMGSSIHPSIHSFKRCLLRRCLPSHCYGLEGENHLLSKSSQFNRRASATDNKDNFVNTGNLSPSS